MLCKEIIEKIEETYPKNRAMDWDNVGLLVGSTEKEVSKIFIGLDLTDEVIEDAIKWGADMIVTHHPLIFSPLRSVTNQSFIGRRVIRLIQHDIAYYAMHTNYDILRMAELASDIIGLQEAEVLETVFQEEKAEGIGKIGLFSEDMTLEECCKLIKERFHLESVKVFGDLSRKVKKAAICPGSGKSVIQESLKKKADVLITGDIDHHEGIDAVARNLMIIDAGHYGLEHIYIEDMQKYLGRRLSGIEIKAMDLKAPFQVI